MKLESLSNPKFEALSKNAMRTVRGGGMATPGGTRVFNGKTDIYTSDCFEFTNKGILHVEYYDRDCGLMGEYWGPDTGPESDIPK